MMCIPSFLTWFLSFGVMLFVSFWYKASSLYDKSFAKKNLLKFSKDFLETGYTYSDSSPRVTDHIYFSNKILFLSSIAFLIFRTDKDIHILYITTLITIYSIISTCYCRFIEKRIDMFLERQDKN